MKPRTKAVKRHLLLATIMVMTHSGVARVIVLGGHHANAEGVGHCRGARGYASPENFEIRKSDFLHFSGEIWIKNLTFET